LRGPGPNAHQGIASWLAKLLEFEVSDNIDACATYFISNGCDSVAKIKQNCTGSFLKDAPLARGFQLILESHLGIGVMLKYPGIKTEPGSEENYRTNSQSGTNASEIQASNEQVQPVSLSDEASNHVRLQGLQAGSLASDPQSAASPDQGHGHEWAEDICAWLSEVTSCATEKTRKDYASVRRGRAGVGECNQDVLSFAARAIHCCRQDEALAPAAVLGQLQDGSLALRCRDGRAGAGRKRGRRDESSRAATLRYARICMLHVMMSFNKSSFILSTIYFITFLIIFHS